MSVVKGQSITVLLEITLTTAGYIPQYLLLFHHGEVDYSVMVGYMALCVCVCVWLKEALVARALCGCF